MRHSSIRMGDIASDGNRDGNSGLPHLLFQPLPIDVPLLDFPLAFPDGDVDLSRRLLPRIQRPRVRPWPSGTESERGGTDDEQA